MDLKAKIETPSDRIAHAIVAALADYPGVTLAEVMGKRRTQMISRARRACLKAAKGAHPQLGFCALGRIFGIDHTSVMYALDTDFRFRHAAMHKARFVPARVRRVMHEAEALKDLYVAAVSA